jgi:hypothetical protein
VHCKFLVIRRDIDIIFNLKRYYKLSDILKEFIYALLFFNFLLGSISNK